MSELKITKEKVLAVAGKCSQAKEALKEMFPEVFEDEKYFDLSCLTGFMCMFDFEKSKIAGFKDNLFMNVRGSGKYIGKAFYLSDNYEWNKIRDDEGVLCLIPTKKQ